jgi:geranylgeranyl reductase family protein
MPHDYDILIAGAGPAGCAAAFDLAHAGRRVLLLDKRSFPRHKACACGLTRKTLKALRYSVDPVIERVCHEIVLEPPAGPHAGRVRSTRVKTRTPICAMAVRERFDSFCLQQTLASARNGGSVSLLKIETIAALRELDDSIELDLTTPTGPLTLTAPVLIGADGSNGQTRRMMQQDKHSKALSPSASDPAQDWYTSGFALEATVPFSALPQPLSPSAQDLVFDFAPLPGGYGWLFPKGDHINIGVGAFAAPPNGQSPQPLSPSAQDLKQVTRKLLNDYAFHKLGVRELAHITGQHLGMGGHTYIPHGRVLLVGDAAGLVDPLTGEGIHSAIVSGQAAAAAILESTRKPLAATSLPTVSSPVSAGSQRDETVAAAYARHLGPLQQTLAFSHRAARAFYREPERGFRAMRFPFMRSLILKTYADGLPHTRLLTALAKLLT